MTKGVQTRPYLPNSRFSPGDSNDAITFIERYLDEPQSTRQVYHYIERTLEEGGEVGAANAQRMIAFRGLQPKEIEPLALEAIDALLRAGELEVAKTVSDTLKPEPRAVSLLAASRVKALLRVGDIYRASQISLVFLTKGETRKAIDAINAEQKATSLSGQTLASAIRDGPAYPRTDLQGEPGSRRR